MKRFDNLSIRKKLFIGMLSFSVLLVVLVTVIAGVITYQTMRNQLIYNQRMSIRWLQDRLNSEVESYSDLFYKFEITKKLKNDIVLWCATDQVTDYSVKLDLITAMNETISMDKNLNSIEIYNYTKNEVLEAKRSGAKMSEIDNKLDYWNQRNKELQTNIVFSKNEKEIVVSHEIYNFSDKTPMVLIVMKLRPYHTEEILEDIKTTDEESILIFNDQNELIVAEYGNNAKFEQSKLDDITQQLLGSKVQEAFQDGSFWFLREVNGGKLRILMTVPVSTILAALSSTLFAGIAIAVFAVIISTIGSILFSRVYSKPIIELSATMRNVTIDDFSDVIVNKRKDEVGILHDSFGVMIERNKKLITMEYQSKIEKREAQIRALQAQINPHFMYNTLQVIGGMALKKSVPELYKITTALGDIMRYSLNFSNEMVCLKEELEYFKAYLTIQNERFGNRIRLEINIPEELMDYLIPKLILQPLLENSLEHGLSNKSGEWRIILKGELLMEEDLLLSLEDNGIGIEPDRLVLIQENLKNEAEKSLKSSSHIGLCNVDARLKLTFPEDKYGISIDSAYGEGTHVQLLTKAIKNQKAEQPES
ncbi:MAG: sensor histidine kinase [Herbinix sp.]|nr:sensor histidine kinase [Herbinix sp.]